MTTSSLHPGRAGALGRLMKILTLALYLVGMAALIGLFTFHWQVCVTAVCRFLGYR